MGEFAQTFYGKAVPGDTIVWARGGRYSVLILGRVDSLTASGNLRITVSRADRSDVKPGEQLIATAAKSMVVKMA